MRAPRVRGPRGRLVLMFLVLLVVLLGPEAAPGKETPGQGAEDWAERIHRSDRPETVVADAVRFYDRLLERHPDAEICGRPRKLLHLPGSGLI